MNIPMLINMPESDYEVIIRWLLITGHIFLADNNTCSRNLWPLVQDADYAQSSAGANFLIKALMNGPMDSYVKTG